MHPCTGTDIHQVIRLADGVFIMLDHQYGVAHVTELQKRFEQLVIITLMQANAGLVENVHDPDQTPPIESPVVFAAILPR